MTFDSAQVPAWPAPSGSTLLFTEREGRYVDFHEYSSDIVAQTILRLGKAVKEASGGRSAVAVSYGYTLELPRAYSGHLSLGQVLASPYVDILTGPISYSGREPGGSAPAPAPLDSIALAGKLWISEDDTKTPKASGETPDGYNPRLTDAEGVRAAHARNFGAALAKGVGLSWMDLWGEGWLDDRETWGFLGSLRAIAEKTAARRKARTKPAPAPEVAVILDERSFFAVREESLLDELISLQRDALLRCGARVGFYLLSDLQKKDFPLGAKLVLFLNAFSLDAPTKAAIQERLQGEGRTLAWVFGPCCREEILSECADVIGMQVKLQPWASKTGATVLPNATSPLTDVLRGQPIGIVRRLNPSFAVTDSRAQTLAEYPAGGVALAIRKHSNWQSVFVGEPNLPLPLLRGLLRVAGIAPLTVDDDVAWVGDGLICLHSTEGGGTNVYLPSEGAIYDVLTGEPLAGVGRGARYSMPLRGNPNPGLGRRGGALRARRRPALRPDRADRGRASPCARAVRLRLAVVAAACGDLGGGRSPLRRCARRDACRSEVGGRRGRLRRARSGVARGRSDGDGGIRRGRGEEAPPPSRSGPWQSSGRRRCGRRG